MIDAKIVPLRAGLEPASLAGEPNLDVVERLSDLLEKAKAGEIIGIAYATLHPGDFSIYSYKGRTTRGLLGALTLLQYDMCRADSEE